MSPLARICAQCRRPVPVDQLREGRCGDCYRGHARARNQRRGNRVWQSHRWRKVGEQVVARDGHVPTVRPTREHGASTRSTQPRGIPPGASPSGAHATAASTRPKRAGAHDQGSVVTVRYTHFPRYDELIC
jgi:hypothetical protein